VPPIWGVKLFKEGKKQLASKPSTKNVPQPIPPEKKSCRAGNLRWDSRAIVPNLNKGGPGEQEKKRALRLRGPTAPRLEKLVQGEKCTKATKRWGGANGETAVDWCSERKQGGCQAKEKIGGEKIGHEQLKQRDRTTGRKLQGGKEAL